METILLVVLIVVAIVMIGLILIQRSEGGGLGIGGPSAMFSARGSGNILTRITTGLAATFMILSLVLAVLSGGGERDSSVMDNIDPNTLLDSASEQISEQPLLDLDPVSPESTAIPADDGLTVPGAE